MNALQPSVVPVVLDQHLDDAAALRVVRRTLVRAPHVQLLHLGRTDERLAAHVDGLLEGGDTAAAQARARLDRPGVGEIFCAAVIAVERRDMDTIERLVSLTHEVADTERALASALGWVSPGKLRGLSASLLSSPVADARQLGLAACALHGVDPGTAVAHGLEAAEPALRRRALQTAAQLGRGDLLPACQAAMDDAEPEVARAAARAALLLGDREAAPQRLLADDDSSLAMALKVSTPEDAHTLLRPLVQEPAAARRLIRGIGMSGDPQFVPWLIRQMADLTRARLAGEAFSLITGLNLAQLDLDRKPPEGLVFGPNDNPADADVALDEDDSLPWPDPSRIGAWWQATGQRFTPGTRYFVGAPPTRTHCLQVLANGFQRQRIAAAHYLCLLQPGTPLFNVAAPTRRQQQRLAQLNPG